MLYDLSFLEPGKRWPPPSEQERMERYEANLKLYENDHDEVYGDWWRTLRQDIHASLEMIVSFPPRLSNRWGDLLVGEPPAYSAGDDTSQDALDQLVDRCRINTVIREACIDYSRFGDGLIRVRTKEGQVVLEAVSPQVWFPVVARADIREIRAHVLAWVFEDENSRIDGGSTGKRQKYLHCEIHEPGRVERRVYALPDGVIGQQLGRTEAQAFFGDFNDEPLPTQTAEMLILHVANDRTTNRLFGYDDYKSIDSYLQETESRLAQWSRINDRHADPPVAGPPISAPEPGTDAARAVATGERYFELESDATIIPQYIQQDLSVETIKDELEWLEEKMYRDSETSATAFGLSKTGYAESGSSLRLRMTSELAKVARIRTAFDPVIQKAIELASLLEPETPEITGIDIGWKDGLPEDEREKVESEVAKKNAGLTSLVSSIMRLENMDRDEAEKEVERIREEQQAASFAEVGSTALADTRALIEGAVSGNGSTASEASPDQRSSE